jgi:hypothetical protein
LFGSRVDPLMSENDPLRTLAEWNKHDAVKAKSGYVVAICLGIASCGRPAFDSSGSLVGASSLPPANELARETIEINRDSFVGNDPQSLSYFDPDRHTLSYELRPDNALGVKHILRGSDGNTVVAEESFRLAPELAERVRSAVWRVRPAKLQGHEYIAYPVGCEPPNDHGVEVAAVFRDEQNRIGIFLLPYDCKDGQAAIARTVLRDVMSTLPPSTVAEGFPKEE